MEIAAAVGVYSARTSVIRYDAVLRFDWRAGTVLRCASSAGGTGDLSGWFYHCERATKYLCPLCITDSMLGLLQLGGIGTVPAVLAGLVLIAIVLLVGRLVMKVAWRLVVIAIIAVGVLWLLSLLGFGLL